MSKTLLCGFVAVWVALVVMIAIAGALVSPHTTTTTLVLILGIVPPTIFLKVSRSIEPQTASQLLRQ